MMSLRLQYRSFLTLFPFIRRKTNNYLWIRHSLTTEKIPEHDVETLAYTTKIKTDCIRKIKSVTDWISSHPHQCNSMWGGLLWARSSSTGQRVGGMSHPTAPALRVVSWEPPNGFAPQVLQWKLLGLTIGHLWQGRGSSLNQQLYSSAEPSH